MSLTRGLSFFCRIGLFGSHFVSFWSFLVSVVIWVVRVSYVGLASGSHGRLGALFGRVRCDVDFGCRIEKRGGVPRSGFGGTVDFDVGVDRI